MADAISQIQKSYFDVLGICCPSEIPLVENIVNSLPGVIECSVVVTTRTVIVVHDSLHVSQLQIVKALNQARLEANVRVNGSDAGHKNKWPSSYSITCGILLAVSLFGYLFHPLKWAALGSVAAGVFPIVMKGVVSVRKLRIDISILAIIAVIGTIVLGDYIEAATIVFLFSIAEWLEARAGHKAQAVMSSLMNIAPRKAVVADSGEEVNADDVKLSTILAVKAGETIPIDGTVVSGNCEIDEKALTGESFPVAKDVGDMVYAGTINLDGYINVKTTVMAADCVVAKMTKLVEEAQSSKTSIQRFIDRCSMYYTPAVILISACIAFVPLIFRHLNRGYWFHLALVVLVGACPCSLILSTPVAAFCALTSAATAGILIKGAEYLETLANIKVMAFDKTGTLTRGEFTVDDFEVLSGEFTRETVLYWVASIESKSSHPMAEALVDHARTLGVEASPDFVVDFQNYPGEGIHAKIDGRTVYVGNKKLAARAGSEIVPEDAINLKGRTVGFVYCDGKVVAVFSMSDKCRTWVKEALNELRHLNIKTCMLTGDSLAAAMDAQKEMEYAVEVVQAELLPQDKARIIESYKSEGTTSMVGDGINDAPALATADIGISMGISGSALATETGQVILMSNDLTKLPKMVKLSRRASSKIIENVVLSVGTKGAILALALAGHPLVWAAVLADVGTCILVILNSMLLLRSPHSHQRHSASHSSHHYHFWCCNAHHFYHLVKNDCTDDWCCGVADAKKRCVEEPCRKVKDAKKDCAEESCCSVKSAMKDCGEDPCWRVTITKEDSCCGDKNKKNDFGGRSCSGVKNKKNDCGGGSCCEDENEKNDCGGGSCCEDENEKNDCGGGSCCGDENEKNDGAEILRCMGLDEEIQNEGCCGEESCCGVKNKKTKCCEVLEEKEAGRCCKSSTSEVVEIVLQ